MADMDALLTIAREGDLWVVEGCERLTGPSAEGASAIDSTSCSAGKSAYSIEPERGIAETVGARSMDSMHLAVRWREREDLHFVDKAGSQRSDRQIYTAGRVVVGRDRRGRGVKNRRAVDEHPDLSGHRVDNGDDVFPVVVRVVGSRPTGMSGVRAANIEEDRLEVALTARHPDSGVALAATRHLTWTKIASVGKDVSLNWPEGTNPEYVSRHPVGPQVRHSLIEDRIRNGTSFAVIAPRRFGKSTLVEYLFSLRDREALAMPRPLVCTEYYSGESFDHQALWDDCSQRLQEVLGSALGTPADRLPATEDFDHVRRAAAHRRQARDRDPLG